MNKEGVLSDRVAQLVLHLKGLEVTEEDVAWEDGWLHLQMGCLSTPGVFDKAFSAFRLCPSRAKIILEVFPDGIQSGSVQAREDAKNKLSSFPKIEDHACLMHFSHLLKPDWQLLKEAARHKFGALCNVAEAFVANDFCAFPWEDMFTDSRTSIFGLSEKIRCMWMTDRKSYDKLFVENFAPLIDLAAQRRQPDACVWKAQLSTEWHDKWFWLIQSAIRSWDHFFRMCGEMNFASCSEQEQECLGNLLAEHIEQLQWSRPDMQAILDPFLKKHQVNSARRNECVFFLICAKRLDLYKDVRVLIAKTIWETRNEFII